MLTEKQLLSARSTSPLKSEAYVAEERATTARKIERVKSYITVRQEKKAVGKLQRSEELGRWANKSASKVPGDIEFLNAMPCRSEAPWHMLQCTQTQLIDGDTGLGGATDCGYSALRNRCQFDVTFARVPPWQESVDTRLSGNHLRLAAVHPFQKSKGSI